LFPKFLEEAGMKKSFAAVVPVLLLAFSAPAANPKFIIAKVVLEIDANGDGTSLPFSVVTYTYDGDQLIRAVSEFDRNQNGIMDVQYTSTWTYNVDGQRVAATNASRTIPAGTITSRSATSYEYNDQGTLIGELFETDRNADGTVDFIQETSLTYDDRGNLVRRVIDSDSDANGTWDSRTIFTRTFDSENHLILEVRESRSPVDGSNDLITPPGTHSTRKAMQFS
jgi:hypothetical protein